jgi:hypothetical protein
MDPQVHPGQNGQDNNLPPQQPPTLQAPGANPPLPPAPDAPPDAAAASWLPPTVPVQSGASGEGQPAAAGQAGNAPGRPMVATPAVADDGDVIEKEWVMKAKRIVDQTRQDPYKQTKELHKFRAEYMKKRYNKVIEPVEE